MTSLLDRIAKLSAERAALAARPTPSATDICTRASMLIAIADPLGPMTLENLRACRVAELLRSAAQRERADIQTLA